MFNKDYILRAAERIGRELSIILGLRQRDQAEEALIYIDNLLLKMTGQTSRFINSLTEEMLVQTISPLGILNAESCLWMATLLKAEGSIYEDRHNTNESFYRYRKALYLFLELLTHEPIEDDAQVHKDIKDLLLKLADYELPVSLQRKLISYYELQGHYARAEDVLVELLEAAPPDYETLTHGQNFYTRLLAKSNEDLHAGNFSRDEIQEGLAHLQNLAPEG